MESKESRYKSGIQKRAVGWTKPHPPAHFPCHGPKVRRGQKLTERSPTPGRFVRARTQTISSGEVSHRAAFLSKVITARVRKTVRHPPDGQSTHHHGNPADEGRALIVAPTGVGSDQRHLAVVVAS